MKVLFDTNVILDALLNRSPWSQEADALWQANVNGSIDGFVAATTLTTVFYISRRSNGNAASLVSVELCLMCFGICPVNRPELIRALQFSGPDFEDNLQIACAEANSIEAIVTRDKSGFIGSPVPAMLPGELLATVNRS